MPLAEPDWALWRSFAAVVADGSLSAAARRIGYSQPTLGRHIETLEQQLGLPLFERTLQGLKPTAAALRLYEPVAAAERNLAQAARTATGTGADLRGRVRISASTLLALHVLPPILRGLRQDFPAIALDLAESDSAEPPRDADIAIGPAYPDAAEPRKLGDMALVCCAHATYLGAHGTPLALADLAAHALVGLDGKDWPPGLLPKGLAPALRADGPAGLWELLKAGLGIGIAPARLVEDTAGMRRLLPMLRLPPLELWLTLHRERFLDPAIRVIYDRMADAIPAYLSRAAPAAPDLR